MENFERIAVGIVLFVITSVVAYLFRIRQLYATTPKLYRHAPISKSGSLCEILVYNKGNQVEEAIQVQLDPDLKIELLASSSDDISLDSSSLKIARLHKKSDASALLLVEDGILDHTKILSVSSNETKGTVCKKVSDIPPNYAMAFLLVLLYVGVLPGFIYGIKGYEILRGYYAEYKLRPVYEQGWRNLEDYYGSELKHSYSNQEFPIRYVGQQTDQDKRAMLSFEIYNKTALPLKVYADKNGSSKIGSPYFASAHVEPMSKQSLLVRAPEPNHDSSVVEIEFSIEMGQEFVHHLIYAIKE